MRLILLLTLLVFNFYSCEANQNIDISQVDNFKITLRKLKDANTKQDSINVINQYYINGSNKYIRRFLESKKITAITIYDNLKAFPKFYESLRNTSINIKYLTDTLNKINSIFQDYFENFKKPNIYIVVGNLSVGGTIKGNDVFICIEMVSDNGINDRSELPPYLQKITNKANLITYICHETVHTLQTGFPLSDVWGMIRHKKNSLVSACIVEGSADYVIYHLFGMNLNENLRQYVNDNKTELWKKFRNDIEKSPFQYNDWIYKYVPRDGRPADIGYFLGFQICESYASKSLDKRKALNEMIRKGNYKKIYSKSEYSISE